jgi:TonB family protein
MRLKEEGVTGLAFTVTADGHVENPTVKTSSGYPDLDEAALKCVARWTYRAAIQEGQAVAVPWEANIQWKIPK